jgi:multiple sugar transport system permease protein
MRYIWYSTSDAAKRISTRVYVENGYGRFVNPTLLRKFGYEHLLTQTSRGWEKSFNAAVERGVPEPYGRNTQFIYRYMSRPIHAALEMPLGQMPRGAAIEKVEGLLDGAAQEVNQKLLGTLPQKEMRKRRLVGGVAMVMVVVLFVLAMGWVWKSFSEAGREAQEKLPMWRYVWGYVLLVPALILIFTWHYLPVLGGAALSFFDFELAIDSEFVGVTNYAQGLYDTVAWRSFGHTIYYVALTLGLGFWPPILVAILLDEVPTAGLKYTFRTIFYLPAIISGVVMLFLWRQLYDPSPNGILNQLITSVNGLGPIAATGLKLILLALWLSLIGFLLSIAVRMKELSKLMRGIVTFVALLFVALTIWPLISAYMGPGEIANQMAGGDVPPSGFAGVLHTLKMLVGEFNVQPLRWLKSPKLAMLCVIIPSVWATSGPGCIIYLAALKTVPMELYEAADIDGAGIIHKICYITLPRIKFLIIIQFIAAAVGSFKGGTNFILALTGGGPNGATRLLSLYIFERAYLNLDFGLAAALAWLLGGLLILLTAFQLKRLARARFTSAATSE